jgi:hypothetical protein
LLVPLISEARVGCAATVTNFGARTLAIGAAYRSRLDDRHLE